MEGNADVIASLFGYKQEVLAKLQYMVECFKTYKGPNDVTPDVFTPAGEVIQLCGERISKVKKYS